MDPRALMPTARWSITSALCLLGITILVSTLSRDNGGTVVRIVDRRQWPAAPLATPIEPPLRDIDATPSHFQTCEPNQRLGRTYVKKDKPTKRMSSDYYAHTCVGTYPMLSRIVPGAEAVILTWNDAVELDLKPNRLTFDLKVDAGRRLVNATKIVLPSLRVGGIEFTNLDAFIARDYEIETTVLGAAFLKRLKVAHATDDDIFMLAKN